MNTQHDITVSGKPLNPPKPPAKPHMLLWIDTETTGLDPNQCELLEVGMQVTDLKAETRGGSLHLIVHPDNVRNWANHPEMLKAYEMHLANGLMLACAEAPKTGYDYKHTALNIHEFLNDQLSQYTLHPAGTNVDYDIDVLTSQLAPLPPPRLAAGTHQPQETRFEYLPDQRPRPRPRPLPGPHGHPQGRRLHPQGHQRLRRLPRHHASRTPRNPIMNTGKRIPATLTAILAILALTACGETPKGDGQGTVNNPDPGYVRWYELPDGSAAVRCFSDSGGASCDWGHIELRDKQ